MRLIRNATEEIKINNKKNSEECSKIYDNIRFCKVQMKFLYNAVVPIVFGFITLCILIVKIYTTFLN